MFPLSLIQLKRRSRSIYLYTVEPADQYQVDVLTTIAHLFGSIAHREDGIMKIVTDTTEWDKELKDPGLMHSGIPKYRREKVRSAADLVPTIEAAIREGGINRNNRGFVRKIIDTLPAEAAERLRSEYVVFS